MTVDRDALIDAMSALPEMTCNCDDCNGWRLDAILPLIADAIEARTEGPRRQPGGYSEYVTYRKAARLVRSLLSDTDGDR